MSPTLRDPRTKTGWSWTGTRPTKNLNLGPDQNQKKTKPGTGTGPRKISNCGPDRDQQHFEILGPMDLADSGGPWIPVKIIVAGQP